MIFLAWLGWFMTLIAKIWLIAIPILWLWSFAYDAAGRPPEGNLAGLLAVASLFYLIPWWLVLFFGGKWLRSWVERRCGAATEPTDTPPT
jgi:hypothetical protein